MQSSTASSSLTTETRADLERKIRDARLKAKQMPKHWVDRQQQVADEVDELVARWLVAEA